MLLEVMSYAINNKIKKTELCKEVLAGLKVAEVKNVTAKDINVLIGQLCTTDPSNKIYYILK